MALSQWSTTAASNATAGSINFAEGQLPSTVNNSARQLMADVRAWYESPEFRDFGDVPTYVSTTSFSVPGNLTSRYQVNRKVAATGTGYTIYGTITSSTYTSSTAVVVTWDSGSLDNTVTSVALGLAATYNGLPTNLVAGSCTGNAATATTSTSASDLTGTPTFFAPITNSLSADVSIALSNTFYDGPSIAQGTSGKWFVSGSITVVATTTPYIILLRLWDGTNVINEAMTVLTSGTYARSVSLSGFISNPAGNLRISASVTTGTGTIVADIGGFGHNKGSTITAIRVG